MKSRRESPRRLNIGGIGMLAHLILLLLIVVILARKVKVTIETR
jgi:hypothetical protein